MWERPAQSRDSVLIWSAAWSGASAFPSAERLATPSTLRATSARASLTRSFRSLEKAIPIGATPRFRFSDRCLAEPSLARLSEFSRSKEHHMPAYIGALDQGTTSTRFIVFDRTGRIVSIAQ